MPLPPYDANSASVRRPGPATLTGPDNSAPPLIVLPPPASSTVAFVRFCGILEEAALPFVSASESRTWMPANSRTGAGSSGGFSLGERFGGVEVMALSPALGERAGPDIRREDAARGSRRRSGPR